MSLPFDLRRRHDRAARQVQTPRGLDGVKEEGGVQRGGCKEGAKRVHSKRT